MANRKVVVHVHAHEKVRYKGEVVVEVPEDIADHELLDAVLNHQDSIGIAYRVDVEDEEGIITDDDDFPPYVARTGKPDETADITLKRKRNGGLRASY